jgi:hypothetical protein
MMPHQLIILIIKIYNRMVNMTIKEDSGNLLLYIYECKIKNIEIPNSNQLLLDESGWNNERLNNAIQYLVEKRFVDGDVIKGLGSTKAQHAFISDITHLGIDIIEAESEFKENFGFTVNLGVIQVNWGVQES